ncbi:DUF4184 family protein [Sanguibacter suarezii]|uniref:DUF4184 family protein n=1 Tax=Sanguibacter suarezii TaxID=60921 RepID=UPI00082F21A2|nr:DUF4184 family protein [Sanguibacter suarezii]
MPFTPAHAIVALPFARRPWSALSSDMRTWALTAVAVGAMAPDLPLFADVVWPGAQEGAVHTHRWPFFPLVLVVALIVTALWVLRVRPAFLAALPRRYPAVGSQRNAHPRGDVDRPPSSPARADRVVGPLGGVLVVVAAATLGLLSHLLWDDVTHLRGATVQAWPLLREPLLGRPVYVYLQHGSSMLGVLVLLVAAARWFRRAVPVAAPRRLGSLAMAITAGVATGMAGATARLLHDDADVSAYSLARLAATFPVLGAAVGLTLWALVVGAPARTVSMECSDSGAPGQL